MKHEVKAKNILEPENEPESINLPTKIFFWLIAGMLAITLLFLSIALEE